MKQNDMPVANPLLVLREEFDDLAVLFDPDTGNGFGLNPVSVFVFNRLDGKHTLKDIYESSVSTLMKFLKMLKRLLLNLWRYF